MKIGIVSDSHSKRDRLQTALEMLRLRGCEAVVHCGDIGSSDCMRLLGESPMAAFAVAGNMDRHLFELDLTAREAGVTFHPATTEVPLGEGRFLVATHGHYQDVLDSLIAGEQFSYVCHGHTHRQRDEKIGQVRVINPGALKQPRQPRYASCALLDTEADTVEFLSVE